MTDSRTSNTGYDYALLVPTLLLVGLGLVIVYSASSHLAADRIGDSYFFLKRQALFAALGVALMVLAKHVPCTVYAKLVYPLLLVSMGLLLLLLVPGFGHEVGGACRWLRWKGLSLQPSEAAKFSLAVYMAYSMAKKGPILKSFSKGLLPHLTIAGSFMLLIVLEPDLGTAVIIGCWLLIVLFVGGVRLRHLFGLLAAGIPLLWWLISKADYRLQRLWAFLDPWQDPEGIGFQIIHSFMAFGSGGLVGSGLGNSKQKLFYLPEAHTDFIFSIVGEELGFLGVCTIVALFGLLIFRGTSIALNARDLYSSYLAFGLTALIALQVLINMAVVMGLLPTKGLTLPLISYGGSSLVLNLLAVGILLNVSSRR